MEPHSKPSPIPRRKLQGLFLNFDKATESSNPSANGDDDLPPGTLSTRQKEQMNRMQPLPLDQFPFGGGFVQNVPTVVSKPAPFHRFQRRVDPPEFLPSSSSAQNHAMKMSREKFYRTVSQDRVGLLKFDSNTEPFQFIAADLEDCGEIGRGAFGSVNRMVHKATSTEMAVKRIRTTVDEQEQKKLLMDLDVVMRSSDCPFIVKFYGAVFWEGDCWICMELMAISLDKFYRFVYNKQNDRILEDIVGKTAEATVKALHYLKETLQIIHRDVKPSNILVDRNGNIKLCDFSISGQLIDSIAKTRDVGCRPYMAPERIEPTQTCYDVRSDVWSLGISLIELATGRFPYPKWKSVFDQLNQVVHGKPPQLECNYSEKLQFTTEFVNFINLLTIHQAEQRPKYDTLLATPYLRTIATHHVPVARYFTHVLNQMTPTDMFGGDMDDS